MIKNLKKAIKKHFSTTDKHFEKRVSNPSSGWLSHFVPATSAAQPQVTVACGHRSLARTPYTN